MPSLPRLSLPSLTLISATVSSSACRIGPSSSSRLTLPACVDTLIVVIVRTGPMTEGCRDHRTPFRAPGRRGPILRRHLANHRVRSRAGSVVCSARSRPASRTSRGWSVVGQVGEEDVAIDATAVGIATRSESASRHECASWHVGDVDDLVAVYTDADTDSLERSEECSQCRPHEIGSCTTRSTQVTRGRGRVV